MNLGLEGKVALITGSSKGIGRSIGLCFAAEGCNVSLSARGNSKLRETEREVAELGVETQATVGDLTTANGIEKVVGETLERWGKIDILVNNVGGSIWNSFVDVTDEEWLDIFNLNMFAAVRASRAVLPIMLDRKQGSIITISSIFGREAGGPASYNATKAAEISMGKTLAKEVAHSGVRVNTVAPGSVIFPGGNWQARMDKDPEGIKRFVDQEIPAGRFGYPDEIADVVVFLASERASWVTGACINVDGCQSRSLI
tara:strand:- start:88536 stop:89306 length:771 start_codon:yes stop_codon:yes gene_type:complete